MSGQGDDDDLDCRNAGERSGLSPAVNEQVRVGLLPQNDQHGRGAEQQQPTSTT
jgi:hypothetical protein